MSKPLREYGAWRDLDEGQRAELLTRGVGKIFDPRLRAGIVDIFEDVKARGDAAVIDALQKFDHCEVPAGGLRITEAEFAEARDSVSPELLAAIRDGISHVRRYNEQVLAHTPDWSFESDPGLTVGEKSSPVLSAGLFIPSGKGSYPSVLVQLGVPAVVAGVPEINVVLPPVPGQGGRVDPACLVVADELGLSNVFRVNGPAGIAALTFGTESISQVQKVCGPGSPPVTCAQVEMQRYGTTGVMLLGPSESLIIADDSVDVRLLAADLLNEAEHGADSTSVLVTDSASLIDVVQDEVAEQLDALPEPRRTFATSALGVNGGAVLAADLSEAAEIANTFAPEHMQIAVADIPTVFAQIHNAGEILLGQYTTVSMANYVIGCPAALPTSGYARVGSGITAAAFRKSSSFAQATSEALRSLSDSVIAFTEHEGFPAHREAVLKRLDQPVPA